MRNLGTNDFWAHRGHWLDGEHGFETDYLTLDSMDEAEQARGEIATRMGLSVDQIEVVPQYNDTVPDLPSST